MSKLFGSKTLSLSPIEVEIKTAEGSTSFIPVAGWHNNYCDFTMDDGRRGTMTFINGSVSIHVYENDRCKKSVTLNMGEIFADILKQLEEK